MPHREHPVRLNTPTADALHTGRVPESEESEIAWLTDRGQKYGRSMHPSALGVAEQLDWLSVIELPPRRTSIFKKGVNTEAPATTIRARLVLLVRRPVCRYGTIQVGVVKRRFVPLHCSFMSNGTPQCPKEAYQKDIKTPKGPGDSVGSTRRTLDGSFFGE